MRDFRAGRRAPVDVAHVLAGLDASGDRAIAAVAALQQGLISTAQLTVLGLTGSAIARRCAAGRLTRVHRGVYFFGAPSTRPEARALAGVLSTGGAGLVSHGWALAGWGILPPPDGPVHITCPRRRPDRPGLVMHEAGLDHPDLAALDGIPLTAPPRSLLDFATGSDESELRVALDEARALELLRPDDLDELRGRTHGHRGWGRLNRILAAEREPGFSRSEAERRLLALIREAGLPEPHRNAPVGRWEVDLHWPEAGLVVEVDGYAFHSSRTAFERDRRKQAELTDLGLEVLRLTWLQITREQAWTVARIAGRLRTRRGVR